MSKINVPITHGKENYKDIHRALELLEKDTIILKNLV